MKRLSLTLLLLICAVALFPAYYAYYPPDDEALRNPALADIYGHLVFGLTNTFHDFNHNLTWVRTDNTAAGPSDLFPNIPLSLETRAPPA